MNPTMERRDVLKAGLAMAGAGALGGAARAATGPQPAAPAGPRRKVLTLAHMTDTHVQPERAAQAGMAAALAHIQNHPAKPELLLAGGDNIMDTFANTRQRGEAIWKIWRDTLANECSLPVRSCIGNHDVWGWNKEKSATTGDEPQWGKRWAMDELGLPERYYTFDQAGWRFVVLDSTHPRGDAGYVGKLDEPQFAWLAETLAATPAAMPVLVLSHIPILAACAYFDGDNEESGDWRVPGAWMHIDARRIKDLFHRHPNVKVCLSGHIHLVDRVDYLGVTYYCNGAASGGWWGGPCQEFGNGYGLVELYDDGTATNQYVEYGWVARD